MKKKQSKVSNEGPVFRNKRHFSPELKSKIVKEIKSGLHTVSEVSRLYAVSTTAVYRWVYEFTPGLVPGTTVVVQMESEAEKTRRLAEQVADLERMVGRKQMEVEFLEKVLELASDRVGYDLKKTFGTTPSSGSSSTATSTTGQ